MPDLPPEELRTMAAAIDAGLQPRVRVELDLSAEGRERLSALLVGFVADLDRHAGIETTWPLHRLLAVLEAATP